jgi:hypothetical protein
VGCLKRGGRSIIELLLEISSERAFSMLFCFGRTRIVRLLVFLHCIVVRVYEVMIALVKTWFHFILMRECKIIVLHYLKYVSVRDHLSSDHSLLILLSSSILKPSPSTIPIAYNPKKSTKSLAKSNKAVTGDLVYICRDKLVPEENRCPFNHTPLFSARAETSSRGVRKEIIVQLPEADVEAFQIFEK